jgi:hypothetical protein
MLPELEIHSNAELSPRVMADLELGHAAILGLPEPALVLAKNGRVAVRATGVEPNQLCSHAADQFQAFYRSRGWIRPWQNVVAVMNFAPTSNTSVSLGSVGVDVQFALKRPPSHYLIGRKAFPGHEAHIIRGWLKPKELADRQIRENPLRAMLFVKTGYRP